MPIRPRELLALLLVLGGLAATLVAWDYGRVDIGMTVRADERGHEGPGVFVAHVTPDGNAARSYISPSAQIIDLTTVDGGDVERGEPIAHPADLVMRLGPPVSGFLMGTGAELMTLPAEHRPPVEAVESAQIARAVVGHLDRGAESAELFTMIDRSHLESLVRDSIWVTLIGIGLGVGVWLLLRVGLARAAGRDLAVLLGAATAAPFVVYPLIVVGTPIGIYAGYVVPASVALIVGLSIAREHPDRTWAQTGVALAVAAAGLVALLVVRYMTSPALSPSDRGVILAVVASVAVIPAALRSIGARPTVRERASAISLGLIPGAALTLIGPHDALLPVILLVALLGWQALPLEQAMAAVGRSLGDVRASRLGTATTGWQPEVATWRDRFCYGLLAVAALIGLTSIAAWSVVVGAGLAVLIGLGVRRRFLGPEWTDAAVPLATAVAVPVILFPYELPYSVPVSTALTGLAALPVAHLLASRHSDPAWRTRLFVASVVVVLLIAFLTLQLVEVAIPLIAAVALVPAIPIAFATGPDGPPAISARLETLAVGLTPAAAATVLVPSTNGVLLGMWLIAVVVWRQFTLNPLLNIAVRTQLQRDLAVAAAETERARLAADLHDDALQQLTMLVRTLDEAGHKKEADEARDIAAKLRSVVGDLRLPILDDLGAGAALEWLVERVEPLAGGPVKLERSDQARPPANVELAVFRVAQEALTNAIKHGRPPIAVRYDVRQDGRVTLAIDDAGEGIGEAAAEQAPHHGHFGLANMQQRAEQIGGLLDVRRWPAGGTRVALEWRPR
jgi:signal transduction histidine kinase